MNKTILAISFCVMVVILAACASFGSQQGSGGDLTGQVWVFSELMGKAPVVNTGISAQFNSDGTLNGSAGCNQYSGKYAVSGSSITISNLSNTMMACDQAVMDQESAYLRALGDAKTYTVQADSLTLFGADGKTLVIYNAQSQDLAGTNWEVIGYNNGKEAVTSVLLNTTISASFGKDGTMSGNAGCNTYSGPFTANGNQIKIGPLTSTMMACSDPAGVMAQETQYLTAVQNAVTYLIEGNVLELRDSDGALVADFNKK